MVSLLPKSSIVPFFLAGALSMGLTAPAASMTDACLVKNKLLVCAEGSKDSKAVLAALANPKTLENLKAVSPGSTFLTTPQESERFRRSVERAHLSARYYADLSYRQFKRKRMSSEFFQLVASEMEKAMANYRAALVVYHSRNWFSPTRDKNAEGEE
ncbi:hypothetical protein ACFQ14_04610 [Pseudahrensia aquimaris]|uniref:Uncharacterized protein n=1 Tax=Pseudahrensia aquimaris TaxID=744461 RepID=A0ABW3FFG2_9HYPH